MAEKKAKRVAEKTTRKAAEKTTRKTAEIMTRKTVEKTNSTTNIGGEAGPRVNRVMNQSQRNDV